MNDEDRERQLRIAGSLFSQILDTPPEEYPNVKLVARKRQMEREAIDPLDENAIMAEARASAVAMIGAYFGRRVDKAGEPMVAHSLTVAQRVTMAGLPDLHQTVALLHDIVEDTDCTIEDLQEMYFPSVIVEAVRVLTHAPGERYTTYIERVATNPIAAEVKWYDIAENTIPSRLVYVHRPAKYDEAKAILMAAGYPKDHR